MGDNRFVNLRTPMVPCRGLVFLVEKNNFYVKLSIECNTMSQGETDRQAGHSIKAWREKCHRVGLIQVDMSLIN